MKRLFLVVFVAVVLLIGTNIFASSIIPLNLEEMSLKAGRIFHGKCTDVRSEMDDNGILSTFVTYKVLRGSKGAEGDEVTFKVFGDASGTSGEKSTVVGGNIFHVGSEDILFLYKDSKGGFTSPVGIWQGDLKVKRTKDGAFIKQGKTGGGPGYKSMLPLISEAETPDELLDKVDNILKTTGE